MIDLVQLEIEVLQRGERRWSFRPVLADPYHLHSHLPAQAATMASNFGATKALAGHIAEVRCAGYLNMDADRPIAPAEVTAFVPMKRAEEGQ
jgi:hypothetical protein